MAVTPDSGVAAIILSGSGRVAHFDAIVAGDRNAPRRDGERAWRGVSAMGVVDTTPGGDDVVDDMRRAIAEGIGTFGLVFAGCAAIVVDVDRGGVIGLIGIALTFGLVLMAMIFALGHISGGHFNPAVTIAFAATRVIPWKLVPTYLIAQLAGALVAAGLLRAIFGDVANLGSTIPSGSDSESFVLEVVMTFLFMFVIIAVATDRRAPGNLAAVAIGGSLGMSVLYGGAVSGASVNPARSLGPAIVSATTDGQWIYIIAPVIGAVAGALLYQFVREAPEMPGP